MKFFIFMIFIPVISGILSAVAGVSFIEDPKMYLAINAPVCLLCTFTWMFTND